MVSGWLERFRGKPGPVDEPAARLLAAREEQRLIETDFAYRPRQRPFAGSCAGRRIGEMLERSAPSAHRWLEEAGRHRESFLAIALSNDPASAAPAWVNGGVPGLDAMLIYSLIRAVRPRVYLEVGSGNSTKFARRAIADGGLATRIVSIDPEPRAEVDALCDEVVRAPFEDVDLAATIGALSDNDVVFIDNSHRSFQNSDVTVFFTEALWALPAGAYWGVHDIFLPSDYPDAWRERFYNEQYLLTAYLLGGAGGDEIVFPGAWVSGAAAFQAAIGRLFEGLDGAERHANAFWMRRGTQPGQSSP
jgi:hypothetical protein